MEHFPSIKSPPPGPNARRALEKEKECFSVRWSEKRYLPFVPAEGQGAIVKDADGNSYLDYMGCDYNLGHCHPEVVRAVKEQAEKLILFLNFAGIWESMTEFACKIREKSPGELAHGKVVFSAGGSGLVAVATMCARYYTNRPVILSFVGDFHGTTPGVMPFTTRNSTWKRHLSPIVGEAVYLPYPDCYRPPFSGSCEEIEDYCVEYLKTVLETVAHPEDVAALLFEPIQSPSGIIIPPPGFWKKVQRICKKNNIVMICDEVLTGMGRTGRMFAIEHFDVVPDIICMGKSFASGVPGAAFIAREEIVNGWNYGYPTIDSFGGNPLACAAGLAGLEVMERENLLEHTARMGDYFVGQLRSLAERHPLIGDVRGKGLLIGVDFVRDRGTKKPATEELARITQECYKRGLIVAPYGRHAQVMRIFPPLNIEKEQIDRSLQIIDDAIGAVEKPG